MLEIKYEIKLNDSGRPCIDLPGGYENNTEDKFFALEIARYLLQTTYGRMTAPPYDANTIEKMKEAITILAQIGDEVAELLWNQMRSMGEIDLIMERPYHIKVNSIEERDALPEKNIIYEGKIFDRVEGLKVFIRTFDSEMFTPIINIYELKGGITNEHWEKIL